MECIQQNFRVDYSFKVHFTRYLFNPSNPEFRNYLNSQATSGIIKKLLFILDDGVAKAHPALASDITTYLQQIEGFRIAGEVILVPGGEACKNDQELFYSLIDQIDHQGIDRHSFVVAIGGGAVLDFIGMVAAVSHRGVRHIRIPTTVLSQNDSGVGVKNGINYHGKKNFLGTFAPPAAVFNDAEFLTTLEERDWLSGISEAVKVALIKDAAFFKWIEDNAAALVDRDLTIMQELIYKCAALHMAHIGGSGDPFETGSSRPLDFGHWSAHKLEQLTDFSLRHGEAVAIGIAVDSVYSSLLGWIDTAAAERAVQLLMRLQLPVYHPLLEMQDGKPSPVIKGLQEFREHLGGRLTITLLKAIGQGDEVHVIDEMLLNEAVQHLNVNYATI